jgi:urease accessory protein
MIQVKHKALRCGRYTARFMSWTANLALDYSLQAGRSVLHFRHSGPLRILQSLYPEGDAICHNVLVHPPGGLVGGDALELQVKLGAGSHALVTTPGATRFYRSLGEPATQSLRAQVAAGARLEWLPLEALAYSGCEARNSARFELQPGAEMMGWDVTALGLPAADQPFAKGSFLQHLEIPGVWLERGRIAAADDLLMNSALGLAGMRCMATIYFITGSKLDRTRRQLALDSARTVIESHALSPRAGATSPNEQVVMVRVLAPLVEPAMELMKQIWAAWRPALWQLAAPRPRIWSM